jgi:hypothetical protein
VSDHNRAASPKGVSHDPPTIDISPETAEALKNLGRLFGNEIPDIDVGQLWRAEWDSVTILGVTLSIEDGYTEFAPVTVDIDFADPYTAILSREQNPLPVAVAVFASLATPVPTYVLEANLGTFSQSVVSELTAIWRASMAGIFVKTSLTLGRGIVDGLEVRSAFRKELLDQLSILASAEITLDGTTLGAGLRRLAPGSTIRPSKVAEILGVGLPAARQIASGNVPLTAREAERLASVIGCDPATITLTAVTVPRELVEALYSPRRFSYVRYLARERNLDYVDAIGYVPAAAAARTQRAESESNRTRQFWEDVLEALVAGSANASK